MDETKRRVLICDGGTANMLPTFFYSSGGSAMGITLIVVVVLALVGGIPAR